ncbi:MAG: hypothetical protein FJ161_04415 [Gammaproteobacteria bacterium]|nr:hypothetical protein [Gammaproteobacteria bacterium]
MMLFIFALQGNNVFTYTAVGLLYLLIVGRRALWSGHDIFSKATISCFVPGLLFCIIWTPALVSYDLVLLCELMILVGLARWPLFFQHNKISFSWKIFAKKILFFFALQTGYAVSLYLIAPDYFESLPYPGQLSVLKCDLEKKYPTISGIQFFYDDLETAKRIDKSLPEVISVLQTSPLYKGPENLVLIQAPSDALQDLIKSQNLVNIWGLHNPGNQKSYYFTDQKNENGYSTAEFYNSYEHPDRGVIIHELTHQMVSKYYGKWNAILFIKLWKDEGYAEYMAATGYYSDKNHLLKILNANDVSDETLENPFPSQSKKEEESSFTDYIAALIQTRYALDEKKCSVFDFFKNEYKPASAQEIREWLQSE